MIRFLHGKEEPSKVYPSPKVWLRSSVVSNARLVFGRRGFQSRRSPNFFTFLCCNCLNCSSSTYIQGSLLNTIFTRRLNKIYFTKKKLWKAIQMTFPHTWACIANLSWVCPPTEPKPSVSYPHDTHTLYPIKKQSALQSFSLPQGGLLWARMQYLPIYKLGSLFKMPGSHRLT